MSETMNCKEVLPLLPFFACSELEGHESEQVAAHLAACASCAGQFEEERRLVEVFSAARQPADYLDASDILLSQCRSELLEGIEGGAKTSEVPRWQPFAWLYRSMALHPAWSAVVLLAVGIAAGTQATGWVGANRAVQGAGYAVNVRATPQLSKEQLAKMDVAGISFAPSVESSSGTVQVHLSADQPMEVSGSLDDADVRRVLSYVVANGSRFDAGMRLDCVEALKSLSTQDADVQQALLDAVRNDSNPAVRMKALDALRGAVDEDEVRVTLLDALDHDSNPGVRVEAINLLASSLAREDEAAAAESASSASEEQDATIARMKRTLQEMTRKDPNPYVRMRSAAALEQLEPGELQ